MTSYDACIGGDAVPRTDRIYYSQIKSLISKNGASLYGRTCSSSILVFSSPVFLVLLYAIIIVSITTPNWTQPTSAGYACHRFDTDGFLIDDDCMELVYGPVGRDAVTDDVLGQVLSISGVKHAVSANSQRKFAQILNDNQGKVGMALYIDEIRASEPRVMYHIYSPPLRDVNAYASNGWDDVYDAFGVDGRALAWQSVVESAGVRILGNASNFKLDVSMSGFTLSDDDIDVGGLLEVFSMLAVMLSGLITMVLIVHFVMDEKNAHLLRHLRQMGMSTVMCWLSYYAIYFVMFAMPAALCVVVLSFMKGTFMQYVPSVYVFLVLWAYFYNCATWSLLLASFPSKSRSADSLVFLFFIIGLLLSINMISNPALITTIYSRWIGDVIDAFAPVGLTKMWIQLDQFKQKKTDMTFNDFIDGSEINSIAYSVIVMFGFSLIVLPVAVYLNLITDGELTPLFFLNASFWTGKPVKRKAVVDGDSYERAKLQSLENAIVALKMTKTYAGGSTACKEFSIIVPNGVVYSILGPNGAGKTTAISMLTGAIQPTNGAAFAYGAPVDGRPTAYVNASSVCPQDNRLWPELTVIQHMNLVVGMKALDCSVAYIDEIVSAFDLTPFRQVPARALSGGTQRRLCVAMACLGNPHILFLDEPTTGLDPITRRTVWNVLEKIKAGGRTSIILCTHSMEEADVLSDNIAIMMDGRLRALGTPMYLKNKFGSGYQVTLIPESDESHTELSKQYAEEIAAFARSRLPHAEVELSGSGISQVVSVTIPTVSQALVPVFLKQVHQSRSLLHIKEWGLQHSTLEQAFLRITQSSKALNGIVEQESVAGDLCTVCKERMCDNVMVYSNGGRAVMTSHVFCSYCASEIIDEHVHKVLSCTAETDDNVNVISDEPFVMASSEPVPVVVPEVKDDVRWQSSPLERMHAIFQGSPDVADFMHQCRAVLYKDYSAMWKQKKKTYLIMCGILVFFAYVSSGGYTAICAYEAEDAELVSPGFGGNCDVNTYEIMLFGPVGTDLDYRGRTYDLCVDDVASMRWLEWTVTSYSHAYPTPYHSLPLPLMYTEIDNDFNDYIRDRIDYDTSPRCTTSALPVHVNYTRMGSVGDANDVVTGFGAYLSDLKDDDRDLVPVDVARDEYESIVTTESFDEWYKYRVSTEYARRLQGNALLTYNEISTSHISLDIKTFLRLTDDNSDNCQTAYRTLRYKRDEIEICPDGNVNRRQSPGVIVSASSNAALRYITNDSQYNATFLATFRTLPFDVSINMAANTRASQMTFVLLSFPVTFVPYVFGLLVMMFSMENNSGTFALSRSMGLRLAPYFAGNAVFGVSMGIILFAVLYIMMVAVEIDVMLEANVIVCVMAVALYSLTEVGTAFIMSALKMRVVVVKAISYAWAVLTLGAALIVLYTVKIHTVALYAFPQFVFLRTLYLGYGGAPGQFVGPWSCLAIMSVHSVVLCGIGLLLRLPRTTRTSPSSVHVNVLTSDRRIGDIARKNNDIEMMAMSNDEEINAVDADVAMEESRTNNSNVGSDMLQVIDLCKTYDGKPPKKALNGVTFGIPKGECFGLLGPNGAGKSTCISVLTASVGASGGLVFADGSVVSGASHEHGVFGICQQDDKLYDDLTTQETLLYYARIKGCNINTERAVAQSAAELIGLDGDAYHQLANTMSGGMKRRLSLACAVIGRPKIVVLDEPTSGLDPETRREVWRAIREVKRSEKCAVLLTTHSMDEADMLSDRIAIMSDGRLKCVGTSTHLKSRFGQGYRLSVNVRSGVTTSNVIDYVKRVVPAAEISRQAGRSLVFTVPADDSLDMPRLFAHLESVEAKSLTSASSLAMATLEDVFMNVV